MEALLQNRFTITAVVLFGIGFAHMMIQKNLVKKVIGFHIMDSAIFLLLVSQGYVEGARAPIVGTAEVYVNPIPSGLVLTGIVVSVSITAFALALIQRLYRKYGTVELDELVLRTERPGD